MAVPMETRPDILIADFEGDGWGGWTAEGTAFGPGPVRGPLPGQVEVTGYLGRGHASSFHGGDPALGRLISPPFNVERRYLSFLIGGGRRTYYGNNDPGYVAVNLVHEGHVVRTAPRSQWEPDGSDHLSWDWFDLADLEGRQVRVEIVDQHTGPWGHILVDQSRADRHAAAPAAVVRGAPLPGRTPLPQPARRPRFTLSGDTAHRRRADGRVQHREPGA